VLILTALVALPTIAHAGVRFGVGVNVGPYYGYGPGYYYPPGYYPAEAPVVESPAYPQPASSTVWYYCDPAKAYYPYVRTCPTPWREVAGRAAPAQTQAPAAAPVQSEATPQQPATFSLGDVLFESGKADLRTAARGPLDQLILDAQKAPNGHIVIEGYTDNTGDSRANQELSWRRAEAVKHYLEEHGIDASRISATGRGDANPVAGNDTPDGRQKNRRVDVTLS